MLVLSGGQAESLFDLGLPVGVAELPAGLAVLDRLLADPALFAPIQQAWAAEHRDRGRPSMAMDRFVRLMIVKARSGGWGYETLVREVSDSLHLRRFCRIALTERVPDESTVRKLVKRLGPDVIEQITMAVIAGATAAGAKAAVRGAGREDRLDGHGVRHSLPDRSGPRQRTPPGSWLPRPSVRRELAGDHAPRVADRSRSISARLRRVNRSIAGRTGQSKELALRLTGQAQRSCRPLAAGGPQSGRRVACACAGTRRAGQAARGRPDRPGRRSRPEGLASRSPVGSPARRSPIGWFR